VLAFVLMTMAMGGFFSMLLFVAMIITTTIMIHN